MKIGIMADTHDHVRNTTRALEEMKARGAEVVLHAGDVVAPFTAKALAEFRGRVHAVFGNNDGERAGLSKVLDIAPAPRELEIGGRRIVLAHDAAEVPDQLAASADLVVTGHTHALSVGPREPGKPMKLNPGEAGGWLEGGATCVVLELDTMEAEVIDLGGP